MSTDSRLAKKVHDIDKTKILSLIRKKSKIPLEMACFVERHSKHHIRVVLHWLFDEAQMPAVHTVGRCKGFNWRLIQNVVHMHLVSFLLGRSFAWQQVLRHLSLPEVLIMVACFHFALLPCQHHIHEVCFVEIMLGLMWVPIVSPVSGCIVVIWELATAVSE